MNNTDIKNKLDNEIRKFCKLADISIMDYAEIVSGYLLMLSLSLKITPDKFKKIVKEFLKENESLENIDYTTYKITSQFGFILKLVMDAYHDN